MKVAQVRLSEHVVQTHSTVHTSTLALRVVCAACVLLNLVKLSNNANVKAFRTKVTQTRLSEHIVQPHSTLVQPWHV